MLKITTFFSLKSSFLKEGFPVTIFSKGKASYFVRVKEYRHTILVSLLCAPGENKN